MKLSFFISIAFALSAVACLSSSAEPEPSAAAAEDELRGEVHDPLHCPHGYCERDNRASLTHCRKGFHVNPYAVCSNDGVSACCQRDERSE